MHWNILRTLLVLSLVFESTAKEEDKPHMSCNITTDFGLQLAGCFFKPFEEIISSLPFAQDLDSDPHSFKKYSMGSQPHIINDLRKAEGVQDLFRIVSGLEPNEIDKIRQRLNPDMKFKSGHPEEKVSQALREHVLKEILSAVDFDEVVDSTLSQLMSTATTLQSPAFFSHITNGLRQLNKEFNFTEPSPYLPSWDIVKSGICSAVDILPLLKLRNVTDETKTLLIKLTKRACNMLSCIENFTEEDMLNDVKFARCFFLCEDMPLVSQCMHEAFDGCKVSVLLKSPLTTINLDWMGDLIMRIFLDYLELDQCTLEASKTELKLQEGIKSNFEGLENDVTMNVRSLVPPGVHCFSKLNFMNTPVGLLELLIQFIYGNMGKCNVELQLATSNYIRDLIPMRIPGATIDISYPPIVDTTITISEEVVQTPLCQSGKAIPQVVIGWHKFANQSSGIIKLNDTNWNETFVIPFRAVIDNKLPIDEKSKVFKKNTDHVTLSVKAGLMTKDFKTIKLVRTDRDQMEYSSCWVVNGPHVRSFDGHYYNNLYEGHFVLYKHHNETYLPYEVQIVNQLCAGKGDVTCLCAVSVLSGNDVFSVDACRREGQEPANVTAKVMLYLVGDLTPGTRIFRENEGLTYKVLLPIGTLVTISLADNRLSVEIRPSAFDRAVKTVFGRILYSVRGMCGNYNGKSNDDLILRNDTKYTKEGNGDREQPKGFLTDWRIKDEDEKLLWGATENSTDYQMDKYCSCSQILIYGVQCTCDQNRLVSDCDIRRDIESSTLVPMIFKSSLRQFYANRPDMKEDDLIDIDDSYTTTEYSWKGDTALVDLCKKKIMNDTVIEVYKHLINKIAPGIGGKFDAELEKHTTSCEDSIQMTGETSMYLPSLMSARQHCQDLLDLSSFYSAKDLQQVNDVACPGDCSPQLNTQSLCLNGTCVCDSDHTGPDCSLMVADPPVVLMPKFSPCDSRYQNCSFATVHGKNFARDRVSCTIEGTGKSLKTHIISPSQIACRLPDDSTDKLTISIINGTLSDLLGDKSAVYAKEGQFSDNGFDFVTYDSLCYAFSSADGKVTERQSKDHCLVYNVCYQEDQLSAVDECYVCEPNVSIRELQFSKSEKCQERQAKEDKEAATAKRVRNIRIIVSCVLCGLVVLITAIVFLISRKNGKKNPAQTQDCTTTNGRIPGQTNSAYEMSPAEDKKSSDHIHSDITMEDAVDTGTQLEVAGGDGRDQDRTTDADGPANNAGNINTREMAEFWRIKHLAAQRSRTRTNSQGSRGSRVSSRTVGSTGIGGSGPSHLSVGRLRSSTQGSVGMGAGGPAHYGRFARGAYSGGSAAADDDGDTLPMEGIGLGGGGTPTGLCVRL